MKRKLLLVFTSLVLLAGALSAFLLIPKNSNSGELRSISSESELYSFYTREGSRNPVRDSLWFRFLTLPFSTLYSLFDDQESYYSDYPAFSETNDIASGVSPVQKGIDSDSSSVLDYSTTNLQVENVDEADLFKTDGNFVYSVSETDVLITDVSDHANPRVVSCICGDLSAVPEELILSGDSLVVISRKPDEVYQSRYSSIDGTLVSIFNIKDRSAPVLYKTLSLLEPYQTSRRIGDRVFVFSSGPLHSESYGSVSRAYEEDGLKKEFSLSSIKYLKDVRSQTMTLVASLDLSAPEKDASVQPFLMDFENAYVSETSVYLADYRYNPCASPSAFESLKRLFMNPGGVIGFFEGMTVFSCPSSRETALYKFDILPSGEVSFKASASLPGSVLSQYSFDEKSGHLRVALHDSGSRWGVGSLSGGSENGTYIAVFDESMNLLGKTDYFGKNESLRASRFVGDKAYVVTYYNTDPLFVVDLADEKNPRVLGELKIPGYSTYLHPYDETHLLGFGVDTEEEVVRDPSTGRSLWTTSRVTGMKVALFDVSDYENPVQLSSVHIGDSRTTSAILSNPKALLFSKEKELLAIPVENFSEDVEIPISNVESNRDIEDSFAYLSDESSSSGYLVFGLNLASGFSQKGIITHDASRLLRGAYIENDLMTVSESFLKFNSLSDLAPLSSLDLTTSKASINQSKIGE
ncbi:beta-propeller domain-containing protein [Candidatus Saccharibacteria bacterium]|nr:beta-propeller domain-containing protein [Candidatus Saccharibacteria bacterium]